MVKLSASMPAVSPVIRRCDPWHYLPIFARKPGALRNGQPFRDWALPPGLAQIRRRPVAHDDGDKQFVGILTAVLDDGLEAVEAACLEALEATLCSRDIVLNILCRRRLLLPQEAPDVLHVDVAKARGDQRSAPARVTRRHRSIENRQGALAGRSRVLRLRAPVTVAIPTAANSTIRARWRNRCSVLVERAKPSSFARSSPVSTIGVASGMLLLMHPRITTHASGIADTRAVRTAAPMRIHFARFTTRSR
jgi:hypothetical protein